MNRWRRARRKKGWRSKEKKKKKRGERDGEGGRRDGERRGGGRKGKVAARLSLLTQSRDEDIDAAATLVGNIFQQQL